MLYHYVLFFLPFPLIHSNFHTIYPYFSRLYITPHSTFYILCRHWLRGAQVFNYYFLNANERRFIAKRGKPRSHIGKLQVYFYTMYLEFQCSHQGFLIWRSGARFRKYSKVTYKMAINGTKLIEIVARISTLGFVQKAAFAAK
jgi:hypothetical protein